MLMPAAWSQSAYAAIDMGEIPDEPIVEYVTRSMSEMRALYGGLLLQLASNVHRCHQIIMYQAGGALYLYDLKTKKTIKVSTDDSAYYRYPHGEATPK